jgi:Glycosyltransferase family 28 N-terminal domain
VIHVIGSRGDVQPFVSLGRVLKRAYGHRVRLATHPKFKRFVEENGLEFFSIGGDPTELMAFMVKNPGLRPGYGSLRSGDIGKRRESMYEMVQGCWRSCIEAGNGMGAGVPDHTGSRISDNRRKSLTSFDNGKLLGGDRLERPFVADVIIANPPSFAHIYCAEKLGIPLHLMFT